MVVEKLIFICINDSSRKQEDSYGACILDPPIIMIEALLSLVSMLSTLFQDLKIVCYIGSVNP